MHDVAVFDDVVLAFEAHAAGFFCGLLAAKPVEVGIGDRLGADEAFLEIRVNNAGGAGRLGAARNVPGARLLRPSRKIRDEAEKVVADADQAVEARLLEPRLPRYSRCSAADN